LGGTPSYSYEWFDGSYTSIGVGDSISGLVGGSYFVKVTDANGCDTFGTLQVLQTQTPLVGQNQIFGVSCKGDSTGMIVSQATGSQGAYRYYWFDPAGDSIYTSSTNYPKMGRDTLSGLFVGTYDLHLYDANGCFESYTITIGEPSTALSIDSVVVSNTIDCYGGTDGGAQTYIHGGMPNYYFSWDNGELSSNAVNLTSGYHVVTLTDDWNCVVKDSVFISENSEIATTILIDNEVSCYGLSDGSISANSVGGSPNYNYVWSNGHTEIGTTTTNSGLIYGSYYLTTQDIYGCEVFDSILVGQPDPLYVEATEIDSISCYGYGDGLAYAYGFGGTEPYTFYWDSLTGYSGDTNFMLTPGVHTVYVVDDRGCQSMDTVFTNQPPVFEVNILDDFTILPYCIGVNTASLTSLANGGTPPYWYEWDDNPVTPQTTPVATNLLAGVYTITVTDYRGCQAIDTRDIDTVTGTITSTIYDPVTYNGGYHVSCYGENDGMLYVEGGGTDYLPFTYQWYGPSGFSSVNDSISNLIAGTYSVTLIDSNNCSVNNSFNITTPDALEYTITRVERNESCNGACNGQLFIDLVGGTSPYVGTSTDQSTGTVISSTMIGDSILGDMCSGIWDVILTDVNGCSSSLMPGGTGQETLTYNYVTSSQVNQSTVQTVLCYGTSTGSLDVLSPNPNTTNYAYNWVNALTGTSVGTGTTISNLPAGTYILEAQYMDGLSFGLPYDGCTTRDTIEITEIDQIVIQAVIRDVDCYDNNTGRISVHPNLGGSVSGGTPNSSNPLYTYTWTGLISGPSNQRTINNLTEGTYSLKVTDVNGCLEIDTFVVTEPDILVANVTQNGATLTVNVTGGITSYSHSWRESSNPNLNLQGGTTYMVLTPGTYYCIVTDDNDCETMSNSFTYDNPTSIDISDISLKIYPNPFRDRTTVDFGRIMIDGDLKVIDILGNVVDVYELENQRELVIERGTKSKGVYFVEIKINNNKIFKKITLQ
ncbi:MAG: T9SS type A sorting domain-containing protein, partial [Flavobacteriales bacterium]